MALEGFEVPSERKPTFILPFCAQVGWVCGLLFFNREQPHLWNVVFRKGAHTLAWIPFFRACSKCVCGAKSLSNSLSPKPVGGKRKRGMVRRLVSQ